MTPFNSNLFPYLHLFLMFHYILPAAWLSQKLAGLQKVCCDVASSSTVLFCWKSVTFSNHIFITFLSTQHTHTHTQFIASIIRLCRFQPQTYNSFLVIVVSKI